MLKKHDWVITTILLILSVVGVFTLLSTNIDEEGNILFSGIVTRQIGFILAGLIGYVLISLANYRYLWFRQIQIPIYLVTLLLLGLVLVFGPLVNDVKRWLLIGGVQFQPSELAKLTVIILSAGIMTTKTKLNDIYLAAFTFIMVLPILLLVYLEPHGSVTLIIATIWALTVFTYIRDQRKNVILLAISIILAIGVISVALFGRSLGIFMLVSGGVIAVFSFYARETWRLFVIGAVIVGVVIGSLGVLGWNSILQDYQKERIETFLSPEDVNEDQAFNIEQSKVAIGSGGIFGKGFGYGTQSRLNYLPEHKSDFIFAAYAEQFGLVGSVFLIGLFAALVIRVILLSMQYSKEEQFASMIMFGIGVMLTLQVFINIGTNTGIIPATGIPLPLISAGGSSILVTFFSFGLIQSIITHRELHTSSDSHIDKDDLLI